MRILIALLILMNLGVEAQSRWKKLNGPVGGTIAALYSKGDTLVVSTHLDKSSIYYSFNGGESWQQSNFKASERISSITSGSSNIFIAVSLDGSIFRSEDLINWDKVYKHFDQLWSAGADSKNILYAGSDRGIIFRSTDEGFSWQMSKKSENASTVKKFLQVGDYLFAGFLRSIHKKHVDSLNWIKMEVDSLYSYVNPMSDTEDNVYFYAHFKIYKSSNYGESWTFNDTGEFFYDNYSYDWIFNNRIIGAFRDETNRFGNGWGIAVSDDEGLTWRWSNEGLPPKFSAAIHLSKSDNNTYLGTQAAGVFKSTNFGDNWFPVNNGLNAADVQDLTFDEMGYMYTASWSNGFQRSTDKGETWEVINNGLTNSYCYSIVSNDSGSLIGSTSQGTFRSLDNGENWEEINFPGVFAFFLRKDRQNRIYALSYGNGLYRTTNLGETWEKLDNGWRSGYVFGLAFDSSGNIYAGTQGGALNKSTDDGSTWKEVYHSNPGSTIHRIVIAENGYIFAASTVEGIIRSTDSGMTWQDINNGIPWKYASSVGMSKKDELFYAVAEHNGRNSREKIYYSKDYGDTWEDYTSGLDLIEVVHILSDEDNVYLATDEAVWRSNPDSAVTAAEEVKVIENYSLSQNYPNPFNPSTKIKYQIPEAGHVTLKVYDILGREAAVLVDKFQSQGEYETEFRAAGLSSGIYFYKLSAGKFSDVKKMQLIK